VRSIAHKLPEDLIEENRRLTKPLRVSNAERLADVSKRVREESMNVNAAFAAFERDMDEAKA
jgi:hypothetical protein